MTAGAPLDARGDAARLLPLAQAIGTAAREMDAPRIAHLAAELREQARALERAGAREGDVLNAVRAALTTLRAVATDIEDDRRHLSGRRARDRQVRRAYAEGGSAPGTRSPGSDAPPRAPAGRSAGDGDLEGAAASSGAARVHAAARRRE
jgi:hypothetical protein